MSGSSDQQDPVAIGGDGVLPRLAPFRGRSGPPVYDGRMTVHARVPLDASSRAAVLLAVMALGAACVPAATSTIPIESPAPSPASTPASSGGASAAASAEAPAVGQTDTSWGRIWDDLPDTFPLFPGGLPAGETSEAASAALTYDGIEPRSAVSWMQSALEEAMYTTEGLNGPLEDGSFVLDSAGPGGCRVQVIAAPLGSLTSLIVRYGADCTAP